MESIPLFLLIAVLAVSLNTLAEGWALKKFAKTPWDKAVNIAATANLISVPVLLLAKATFSNWDQWLPYNPIPKPLEITLLWIGTTTIVNAIELMVIRNIFKQPTPRGFLITTALTNGLTALADLWESFQHLP